MGEPTLKWSYPPSTVDPSSPSTNSVGKFLYNNAFVFDSSAPATHANGDPILDSNGNPAVPITNYKKTRSITHDPGSGTEGDPGYVAPTTTTSYTSSNPVHNNLIALKGGVYEKAEFITSTIGSTSYPTTGNPAFQDNVVFIDSGSVSPLSFGPIIPYADGNSQGANIEANVGWTASTLNATAGFHSNNRSTPITTLGNFISQSPSSSLQNLPSGIPYFETTLSNPVNNGPAGTGTASFPGNSGIGPSFSGIYRKSVTVSGGGFEGADYSGFVQYTVPTTHRIELWAPQKSYSSSTYKIEGAVKFEFANDKMYDISPLSALTVTGTATIQPFGNGKGGRLGDNSDINVATHAKATVTTSTNHNLSDANNRIYVTGASQVQMNGWHYVYDVSNATTFSYVVPLSLSPTAGTGSDGVVPVSGTFTVETYDGIDKPGGVLKNNLNISDVRDVREYYSTPVYHANGDIAYIYSSNFYYRYTTTENHGFLVGDSFTVSGTDAWSGTKTVTRISGGAKVDFLYQHIGSGSTGTNSISGNLTGGGQTMSSPTRATIRAGGNAGNDRVILFEESGFDSGSQYQFYPNTSYANAVYNVQVHSMLEDDASLFKKMGLEINEDTGVVSSNGAYDGVNNKGIRSLDSFYPKFLEARNNALNSTVTSGTITQSNTFVRLNNVERLPTGHLKTLRYANGLTTIITGASVATLDTDDDGNVLNYPDFQIESGNTASTTRAAVEVENNIGEDNTITESDYTLTYVDNSFPVANSSAFFSLQKQNNTPIVSGTSIVAFVGPDEQFHVPIWGSIKAYKDPNHLANISGRTADSKDYAYQEFCIRVYKNMNADRDDTIVVYSDPDNQAQPVDEDTAFTFTQGEDEIPITNSEFLANSYANSSMKHF